MFDPLKVKMPLVGLGEEWISPPNTPRQEPENYFGFLIWYFKVEVYSDNNYTTEYYTKVSCPGTCHGYHWTNFFDDHDKDSVAARERAIKAIHDIIGCGDRKLNQWEIHQGSTPDETYKKLVFVDGTIETYRLNYHKLVSNKEVEWLPVRMGAGRT